MSIQQLIEKIRTLPDCEVYPAAGLPAVEPEHSLPVDVREFYQACGGVELFKSADYAAVIVTPQEFVLANPVIVGERYEEDITSNFYIIAREAGGEYLTIDLDAERLGRCYDSFSDRHGIVGETQIIALSFTELLENLIRNKGRYWYWLEDDHVSLGDAYDDIELED
ncbi:SMI1/KNR4 family protein [Tumebacillus sp. DT12]|uniref:SMI1/KNR4 family protein n=1 Tax=Tumebacillus lacus TaxID=2995335 RepID=A0ABT3X3A1_9BACL|nr:SMI1/KNR4 family protein [Tumebacillus lacus]MCX7571380.1 SMI1/KNR4 family protein [Tumebacillus lacus]